MRRAWQASPNRPVGVNLPLFGNVLAFDLLRGFVPAYQAQNSVNFILEFIPDGQTFQNWTEMVTVTATRAASDPRLKHAAQAQATFGGSRGCSRGSFYRQLRHEDRQNGQSLLTLTRGCAAVAANAYPGARATGEQALILHFRDAQNVYTLQYAVRRPFSGAQPPIPDADVAGQLAKFGSVQLCPRNSRAPQCAQPLGLEKRRAAGQ